MTKQNNDNTPLGNIINVLCKIALIYFLFYSIHQIIFRKECELKNKELPTRVMNQISFGAPIGSDAHIEQNVYTTEHIESPKH